MTIGDKESFPHFLISDRQMPKLFLTNLNLSQIRQLRKFWGQLGLRYFNFDIPNTPKAPSV